MTTDPRANNVLVETLGSTLRHGGNALTDVPGLLKRLLAEEAWRDFTTRRSEAVHWDRFADFVTTAPLKGLGSDVALVERIVAADDEAVELLRDALKEKPGPKRSRNNITESQRGDSRAYSLERLHKNAPELHAEVLAGNLSAHAAMVRAGFRPKTISVPVTRPDAVARALLKYMSAEDIAQLITYLLGEAGE